MLVGPCCSYALTQRGLLAQLRTFHIVYFSLNTMASAAPNHTSSPEDAVNGQECLVCMERYRDPRVQQCAHHFCKVCLEEIADRHPQGSVTCPTYRQVTPIEGDAGVCSFPRYRVVNDFSVSAAIAAHPNVNLNKRHCDVCKDKATTATRVCFGCILSFCDSCHDSKHAQFQSGQEHQTFPISSHIFCDCHENSYNVFVCKTCRQMCCPLSAFQEHAEHECRSLGNETMAMRKDLHNTITSIMNTKEEKHTLERVQFLLNKAKEARSDFYVAIESFNTSIKQLQAKVVKIEKGYIRKLNAEIKHLEITSCDLDDFWDSTRKLEKHLIYLTEEASNQELFTRQTELPKWDPDFYKRLISKPKIELPELGNTLTDITAHVDKFLDELNIHYDKYLIRNHCKVGPPFANLNTKTNFNVGQKIYGLAVDSGRERLVVRRNETTAPITVYDFHGQQLQVLGKDVEGITGTEHQGIALDTKRDLFILPVSNGSLRTMDIKGTIIDKFKLIDSSLYGAAYCETDFYVTSSTNPQQVYLIDPNTKQKVASFSPNTLFNSPLNVHSCEFTSGGFKKPVIIVSNRGSDCIKVLDMSGHHLQTYGKEWMDGAGDGQLDHPWCVYRSWRSDHCL